MTNTKPIAALHVCGREGKCNSCGALIWWLKTKSGKSAPFDADGGSHFAKCPQASLWRKSQGGECA